MAAAEISHIGKIVDIAPDFITVEIVAESACATCHAAGLCGTADATHKAISVPVTMGDWHVGRALLRRWALLLYGCYALMAAGFALIGLAKLGWLAAPQTAGVHLLTAGSFSLIIFTVMVIAGYTHSGLKRDRRPWVLWAAGGIVTAAVLRVLAYWVAPLLLQGISGLLWAASFAAMAWHMLPVWLAGRVDGRWGGHGVLDEFTDDALRLAAQAAQGKGAGAS